MTLLLDETLPGDATLPGADPLPGASHTCTYPLLSGPLNTAREMLLIVSGTADEETGTSGTSHEAVLHPRHTSQSTVQHRSQSDRPSGQLQEFQIRANFTNSDTVTQIARI